MPSAMAPESVGKIVFFVAWVIAMAHIAIAKYVIERVKDHHHATWVSLGSPGVFVNGNARNAFLLWRFITFGDYRLLQDDKLNSICRIDLALQLIFMPLLRKGRFTMTSIRDDVFHISEREASRRLAELPLPFAVLLERGDLSVELYAPRGVDTQSPHTRDELYIVASGTGTFHRADQVCEFKAGDMLFVPAHVEHRFDSFSDGFSTWVIFFGPEGGMRG